MIQLGLFIKPFKSRTREEGLVSSEREKLVLIVKKE